MFKPLAATLAAVALIATAAIAAPVDATLHEAHSSLKFTAYTKLFDVEGTFKKWSVSGKIDPDKFEDSRVTVSIDATSIDTDNGLRDTHLKTKDFFWIDKHPTAGFETVSIAKKSGDKYVINGKLTLRGVTKTIMLPVTVTTSNAGDGKRLTRVKGGLRINRFDWGIPYKASLVQPNVEENVDIKIDVNFKT